MALRPNQRPGYSRKAQYSLFIGYVLAISGALIGLLLVIISAADPKGFAALRMSAAEIFAPASRAVSSVTGSVGTVDENVASYWQAGSQNRALRNEVRSARVRLIEARALEEENKRLRALLTLSQQSEQRIAIARMLSSSATSARRFALIDAGRNKGIEPGQAVRAPDGLIGRVLEVGPTVSRILLLTDADNIVPVRRTSDGLPALATGRGDGMVDIKPLNNGIDDLKPGDIFVTSGSGGFYQPRIPVAVVYKKISDGAIGRPLADPARVDAVMIERVYRVLDSLSNETQPESAAAQNPGGSDPKNNPGNGATGTQP
jgi:rod shape-determining protein MreC